MIFKNIINLEIITRGESELDELQLFIHKKLLLFIEILKKLIFNDDLNKKIKVIMIINFLIKFKDFLFENIL